MNLKERIITARDNYVMNQVANAKLPKFHIDEIKRFKIIFSGRVQHVGFRLEVCELAKRLDLTGFCVNLESGNVLAEIQGPENKIKYLVSFMESLKRIKIKKKIVQRIELDMEETEFVSDK